MLEVLDQLDLTVHRHTGGLEMIVRSQAVRGSVHRHTGGLEMLAQLTNAVSRVHRHTGGLEIQ